METILVQGDLESILCTPDDGSSIKGSEAVRLTQTIDAEKWADEFMRFVVNKRMPISKGLMLGWFANAIMTGYDWAKRESPVVQVTALIEGELKMEEMLSKAGDYERIALIGSEFKTPDGPRHPTAHRPNCECVQTERIPF